MEDHHRTQQTGLKVTVASNVFEAGGSIDANMLTALRAWLAAAAPETIDAAALAATLRQRATDIEGSAATLAGAATKMDETAKDPATP